MSQPQKILELEFSHLKFYDHYVISQLKEDVVFDRPQVQELIQVCNAFFKGRKYVYISHRVHNYNVNPTIYLQLQEAKNLSGIAIVSQKTSSLNMAAFEKNFAKVPFEVFLKLKDAKEWAIPKVKK